MFHRCSTEVGGLHSTVIDLAGVQVLHVLGPALPLAQGREVHRTAVATMRNKARHQSTEVSTEVGGNTRLRLLPVGTV